MNPNNIPSDELQQHQKQHGSKKSLLYRLIQSEMFSLWMGLTYLQQYSAQEVGIHHYICERMRSCPSGPVEFMIPQICHLIVCSFAESAPLEYFLLELCQRSIHASILTLWTLENYLTDWQGGTAVRQHQLYDRCARFLGEVQAVVFGEHLFRMAHLRSSASRSSRFMPSASIGSLHEDALGAGGGNEDAIALAAGIDTMPNLRASIVAFGCVSGVFAHPKLIERGSLTRDLILTESRKNAVKALLARQQQQSPKTAPFPSTPSSAKGRVALSESVPSLEDLHHGKAFSLKEYLIKAARQMNVSPPAFMKVLKNRGGSSTNDAKSTAARQSQSRSTSVGNINVQQQQMNSTFTSTASVPIYYHSEMQFIMSLIDLSRRLCLVEKDGRQHALQAELTLLNHNLPAPVCLPLWCGGGAVAAEDPSKCIPHHRILRIVPEDAVVLNSAERVPFVLYVEIDEEGGDSIGTSSSAEFVERSPPSEDSEKSEETIIDLNELVAQEEPMESQSIETEPDSVINVNFNAASSPLVLDEESFSERMRTAAIMLTQLTRQATQPNVSTSKLADINAIKARIIGEMEALEKMRLLDALESRQSSNAADQTGPAMDNLDSEHRVHFKDDPSAPVFREAWMDKLARIKAASPYGHLPGWNMQSVIVKASADMRQEQLACQLIQVISQIWDETLGPGQLWTYPFQILVAASNGGLVETVRNAVSIHSIKKAAYKARAGQPDPFKFSLRDHFIKVLRYLKISSFPHKKTFGSPDSRPFLEARGCFISSLAAYSLITYVLLLRDRHNGNILLDRDGHVIHIDFGFMLSNAPGGYVGFESAPFKLSPEYIELMGGSGSPDYARFKDLIFQGFQALRKHAERIFLLVEIMQVESRLPCFSAGEATVAQLRQRLQLGLTEPQLRHFVERMITSSAYNIFTKLYDSFQYYSNGIL